MKINNVKISIIVPVYNVEKYIEKCLESILQQSYSNIEILVINDGSNDKTEEKCRLMEQYDSRIRVLSVKNGGVSKARNIGIQYATGKYVIFVDGDDFVSKYYVETLFECIEHDDVGLGIVDYYVVRDKEILTSSPNDNTERFMTNKKTLDLLTCHHYYEGYLWNKIFVRDIIIEKKLRFDENVKIWEDLLFCTEYLMCGCNANYRRSALYYYVVRNDSTMSNETTWKEMTHMIALERLYALSLECGGVFATNIRNIYANNLVGILGSDDSFDIRKIRTCLTKIKSIKGKLSAKHKVKYYIIKISPRFYFTIKKLKDVRRLSN